MELNKLLLVSSKKNINQLVSMALKDTEIVKQLVSISLSEKQPKAWRATWALSHYAEKDKGSYLTIHLNSIIRSLFTITNHSQRREYLKILNCYPIPKEYEVQLYDFSLKLIQDPNEALGTKYHLLRVIKRFIKNYPELMPEAQLILNAIKKQNGDTFSNAAEKLLK